MTRVNVQLVFADRGTFHAMGLVTDAELFLRQLARELGVKERPPARGGRLTAKLK